MDSILSKTLQRFANDQARAYIDKKDVVLDTPSADNLYKICRDFMSFLDDSGNKTISDKLHTIDEDSRVEEVVKLLRVQINNSKRRKYKIKSKGGSATISTPAQGNPNPTDLEQEVRAEE